MLNHEPLARKLSVTRFLLLSQRVQLAFLARQTAVSVVLFQPQVAAVCQALGLRPHRQATLDEQLEVVYFARAKRRG